MTTSYVYNALSQRVAKSSSAGSQYFFYDEAGHLLGEYAADGSLIEETVWMNDLPVATLRPHAGGGIDIYYVHTDQLGAPRKVTRPSDGVIVWRWDPSPFGDTLPNENPQGAGTFQYNLRFPGQYFDVESGLSYNYRRDYDPYTGRYVESDPIGLRGGINTYAYAAGSPILNIDPFGLDVTVAYFPGGPGHIGIGVNSTSTSGLYPLEANVRLFTCRDVAGQVQDDQLTQDSASKKKAEYLTIKSTPVQDALIQHYINAARNNENQTFNLCSNQCTTFVRHALQAGGVPIPDDSARIDPSFFFRDLKQVYGPTPAGGKQ